MVDLAHLRPLPKPSTTPAGQRILLAASSLFYSQGIASTGLDLVVEHAGVTKRTLYQRFGSKDGLVCAYLTDRANRWQQLVLNRLDEADTADLDLIDAVFDLTHEWIASNPRGCGFVNAWAELGNDCGTATKAVIQSEKRWMRTLFVALTGNTQTGELVHELYEGALVCAAIFGDFDSLERAKIGARKLTAQPGNRQNEKASRGSMTQNGDPDGT